MQYINYIYECITSYKSIPAPLKKDIETFDTSSLKEITKEVSVFDTTRLRKTIPNSTKPRPQDPMMYELHTIINKKFVNSHNVDDEE